MHRTFKFYENYVCPYCLAQIPDCICADGLFPPHMLIHVDEGIQPIIKMLNRKGYHTTGCCESHFDGNRNLYVAFADGVKIESVPEGFRLDGKVLSYRNPTKSKKAFDGWKTETIENLWLWANNLEDKNGGQ